MRKGGWEKRKVMEARKNSKILWNVAKEIAGKKKRKDEQVYVYTDNMEKIKIEEAWNPFMSDWKVDIYQKTPRMSLDFWYGTTDEIGLKENK